MEKDLKPVIERRGCSTGAIALGCGGLLLLSLIVVCGVAYWGARWAGVQVEQFVAKYEAQGYERRSGQVIEETARVESPRVYTAQVVNIREGADANLAIMSQAAEIHGTVAGDIDFYGQVLTIKPDAVVTGDIRVQGAQVINVEGSVEGEITGPYQILNWPNRTSATSAPTVETDDVATPPTATPETEPAASPPE